MCEQRGRRRSRQIVQRGAWHSTFSLTQRVGARFGALTDSHHSNAYSQSHPFALPKNFELIEADTA